MKIILYKDVPNLGEEGDVRVVADGYARNYLIPRGFAVHYTKATETELAQKEHAIARRKEEKVRLASGLKARIEDMEMKISLTAGGTGRLFGSVTSAAISDYLNSQGLTIERKKIELPEGGIKTVGTHTVTVRLYGGEETTLAVKVNPSDQNASPPANDARESISAASAGSEEDAAQEPLQQEKFSPSESAPDIEVNEADEVEGTKVSDPGQNGKE